MPDAVRPSNQTHTMVRGRHEWYCVAKNPRCLVRAALDDMAAVFAHMTASQQDLRHLPPLPGIVGDGDDREAA